MGGGGVAIRTRHAGNPIYSKPVREKAPVTTVGFFGADVPGVSEMVNELSHLPTAPKKAHGQLLIGIGCLVGPGGVLFIGFLGYSVEIFGGTIRRSWISCRA